MDMPSADLTGCSVALECVVASAGQFGDFRHTDYACTKSRRTETSGGIQQRLLLGFRQAGPHVRYEGAKQPSGMPVIKRSVGRSPT